RTADSQVLSVTSRALLMVDGVLVGVVEGRGNMASRPPEIHSRQAGSPGARLGGLSGRSRRPVPGRFPGPPVVAEGGADDALEVARVLGPQPEDDLAARALLLDGDEAELDELEQRAERTDQRFAAALGLEALEQGVQGDLAQLADPAGELVDVEA